MVLAQTVVARAGIVALLALGACADDDADALPDQQPRVTPELSTASVDGAPSEAALHTRDSLLAEPIEGEDCGRTAADSGWPTTAVLDGRGDCLVATLGTGRAATQTFTGRTGDGGALIVRYVVRADGTVAVERHVIARDGRSSSDVVECGELPVEEWTLDLEGRIQIGARPVC